VSGSLTAEPSAAARPLVSLTFHVRSPVHQARYPNPNPNLMTWMREGDKERMYAGGYATRLEVPFSQPLPSDMLCICSGGGDMIYGQEQSNSIEWTSRLFFISLPCDAMTTRLAYPFSFLFLVFSCPLLSVYIRFKLQSI
jgi:hypothetical protein